MTNDKDHFRQPLKREADFIKPFNTIKAKVGAGGIDSKILERAEKVLKATNEEFIPHALKYLKQIENGIVSAKKSSVEKNKSEELIRALLYPAAQLKANGGMFNFPLITRISDRLVQFLEVVDDINPDMLEITDAFLNSLRRVITNKLTGDASKLGDELMLALNDACQRYFEKHKS